MYYVILSILAFNTFVGIYYGIYNLVLTLLFLLALFSILRYVATIRLFPIKDLKGVDLPPVSLIIPAYNEEKVIVRTVQSH